MSIGTGMLKFLVSVIIAGFLFSPGPLLVAAVKKLARRIDATHGEKFVVLAGATIRAVSRGVIGIAILQAVVGGLGNVVGRGSRRKPFDARHIGARDHSNRALAHRGAARRVELDDDDDGARAGHDGLHGDGQFH